MDCDSGTICCQTSDRLCLSCSCFRQSLKTICSVVDTAAQSELCKSYWLLAKNILTCLLTYLLKPKFHLARHVTSRQTRHVRRVKPMHFGCVELVEQHGWRLDKLDTASLTGSTCSSQEALTGSTRWTCPARALWLSRACRTAWLDMLDTTSSTCRTCRVCREVTLRAKWNLGLTYLRTNDSERSDKV